jgi:hypothetical protein
MPIRPLKWKATYKFHQTYTVNFDVPTTGVGGSYSLSLGNLPDVTAMTTLFDFYRFREIAVAFSPSRNLGGIQTSATAFSSYQMQRLYTAVCLEGLSAPSNANGVMAFNNCVTTQDNEGVLRKWKPSILQPVFTNTATAYAVTSCDTWLSTLNTAVPYYGLLYWADGAGSVNSVTGFLMTIGVELELRVDDTQVPR